MGTEKSALIEKTPTNPKIYRNWENISAIPDKVFMWSMALLDIDSEFGRKITNKFPDYFTTDSSKAVGPIPISAMVEMVREEVSETNGTPELHIASFSGARDVKGLIWFTEDEDYIKRHNMTLLPTEIEQQVFDKEGRYHKDAHIGMTILWGGKEFVLLEAQEEIVISPTECVLVDYTYPLT